MQLYPLKFKPQVHNKIWGGNKLSTVLNKELKSNDKAGESWEVSGLDNYLSIVSNGMLSGNNIEELIEIFMGELVGDKVYEEFGLQFPLLIKFIDAATDLSVQVHPNDEIALEKHQSFGKTEMWYIVDASPSAKIVTGFKDETSKELLRELCSKGKLEDLLHYEAVSKNDAFFIPPGTVHAIGEGCLVVEVQQASDITYRLYDYNRTDSKGNKRELHLDLSLDAINYTAEKSRKVSYITDTNKASQLVTCNYFTTNIIHANKVLQKDIYELDSFVIYICVEGNADIKYNGTTESLNFGETILIPASCHQFEITPKSDEIKLLEVHL